jgi:glycosyltransferase involved in cell wall biosynthesis
MPTLSVVVPVYNERKTLERVIERIERAKVPEGVERRILCIDDCSNDGTRELLGEISKSRPHLRVLFHEKNRGKGAAIRTGFAEATGDIVLIQDADLEYDPSEYPRLLAPILDGRADVVYGSRFIGETHRVLYFWHYVGNRLLTTLSNMCSNLNLTDMECCYKVFRRDVLDRISIEENRFGIEPELTAKVASLGARIYEVPVSYSGRTYAEGKKINWKDGVSALRCILKYNLFT